MRAEVETAVEEVRAEVETAVEEVRAEMRVGTDGRVRQNHVTEIRIVKLFDFLN